MENKHFAFILHYPHKDKCVLWPGYYEDHAEEILKDFKESETDIRPIIGWHSFLTEKQPYKIFIKKTKEEKQK